MARSPLSAAYQADRVEPVALGVLGVVGAQVGGLLGRDQHHVSALTSKPGRQGHPGVARRLHHDGEFALTSFRGQARPQLLQVGCCGPEPMARPKPATRLIGQVGLMCCSDHDVYPPTKDHVELLSSVGLLGRRCRERSTHTRQSLTAIHVSISTPWSPGSQQGISNSGIGPFRQHGQQARSRIALHSVKQR